MCGILGIFNTASSSINLDPTVLTKMRDTMVHRGPDDAGVYIAPNNKIGLAHRRLSIIDLSASAVQPMPNQDKSHWIVFNGEIYNHAQLRKELIAKGHKFRTHHSDTEVLLVAYQEWGEDMLKRLRGMFAFCIWDQKQDKIWLVRDRLGIKPLYFTRHKGSIIFASEIKAILAYPGFPRKLNEKGFYDFLTFLVAPAPDTLFDGIAKVPAGVHITIYGNGKMSVSRYWNPFTGIKKIEHKNETDWCDEVLASLRGSIGYRMVSDVKFGVFLSGGIDSSANVVLMDELMKNPVETFTIGFEEGEKFNELEYARQIVEKFKTSHHEIIINSQDLVDFLPKLVFHQDEPIVDPVCVPVYYVSKLAKDNGTTVCQVGEGSDELFCGYPYWGMNLDVDPWVNLYQKIPAGMRKGIWSGLNSVFSGPSGPMRMLEMARRASFGEKMFWGGAEAYQETYKKRFLSESFLSRLNNYSSYDVIRSLHDEFKMDAPDDVDTLHWMTYLDLRFRLPELLLMRVDKMTMANSVESRVPFLDHEFVRLAMSMPQTMKYKNRTLKYLLKKSVEPILPHDIIYRRKQGFGVPVANWFQNQLWEWSEKKIKDFVSRTDYFNPEVMSKFLNVNNSKISWFLLNFVLWHEVWIEQKEIDLPV